jgi:hypothetical protein
MFGVISFDPALHDFKFAASTTGSVTGGGNEFVGSDTALPVGFAEWLRKARAETIGSAREAYEKVAERLNVALPREDN